MNLPSGTVTFFFTDIAGSTQRWEREPERMRVALARHDDILRAAIEGDGGIVFKTVGDAFYAVFTTAPAALAAALAAQRALDAEEWDEAIGPLRVRVALHTGTVVAQGNDYFGRPLNRVARLLSAGNGGQILLSAVTEELVRDQLPPHIALRDLGFGRLKDLLEPEHIFQVVAPDLASDFPPLKTLDARPTNLPAQATQLIGREREVQEATALLGQPDVRVLTLTGPGGTGKTRLGLQIAAEMLDEYPDGVFFVPLDDVRDPALLPLAVARAIGIADTGVRPLPSVLGETLRNRRTLLLLDNFEQIAHGGAVVAGLLAGAPDLNVLVTSRIPLRVYGEREFPVAPLALPEPRRRTPIAELMTYEAIRLFVARAQSVRPGFALTAANAADVVQICRQLDGLPLAIELAAARLKLLSPHDLVTRLDHRLQTLTRGALNLPERQQTLRGAIAWSHDLLNADEQALFARISIFTGGCTLDAAEAVCNAAPGPPLDVPDILSSLVDKSLVVATLHPEGDARFAMLGTIREYAAELLAERPEHDAIAAAHAAYYRDLAEGAESGLAGPGQAAWLARYVIERENGRAALEWAVATENAELAVRLCGAVWRAWSLTGDLSEGREWLETCLAIPGAVPPLVRARALDGLGEILQRQRAYDEARARFEESLVIRQVEGNLEGAAHSLSNLGGLARERGDTATARARYEDCLAIRRSLGDEAGIARTLTNLGILAWRQGDVATARDRYTESLAIGRKLNNQPIIAYALSNLGIVAQQQRDYPAARAAYAQALDIARQSGDLNGVAAALNNLGTVAQASGDLAAAHSYYAETVAARRDLGDTRALAFALNNLGTVAHREGAHDAARAAYAESLQIRRDLQQPQGIILSLTNLGALARDTGDMDAADAAYTESIALSRTINDPRATLDALDGLAAVMAARGDTPRAATLWAAVEHARTAKRIPAHPADTARRDREIAAARAATDPAAWDRAWAQGATQPLDHAIADTVLGA